MANRRLAPAEIQPPSFAFTPENEAWADGQIRKYPEGRQASAVIPLLWRAQEQNGGWLPQKAIEEVARKLGMPPIRVLEVATFYTMFALEPVGRYWIQLCGTVPCNVCGAQKLKAALQARIGPPGHVTPDGNFSWIEVECLGACCNAPMAQINHDYYEDLSPETLNRLLNDLAAGRPVRVGSQKGRRSSEPKDAVTTLTEASLYDGSRVGAWRERFAETHIDGAAHVPVDAMIKDSATKDEAASSTQRAKEDPKPARPEAGRATESAAADTPAVRAAEGEAPTTPDDAKRSKGKAAGGEAASRASEAAAAGDATTAADAADAAAVAADRTLRTEPPAQPKGFAEEPAAPADRPMAGDAAALVEKERVRVTAATAELIVAHPHHSERRDAAARAPGHDEPARGASRTEADNASADDARVATEGHTSAAAIEADPAKPAGASLGGDGLRATGAAAGMGARTAVDPDAVGTRPAGLDAPRGGRPDDLKRLGGIGPANERRLHALGIFHFSQIAAWSPAETAWVGVHLAFPGRIERENWVGQAKAFSTTGALSDEADTGSTQESTAQEGLGDVARSDGIGRGSKEG